MIKAEDLRIGDIVRYGKNTITILAVHANGGVCFADGKDQLYAEDVLLEPILLTPEILEKNGWKKRTEGWYFMMISKYMYLSVEFGYENGIRVFLKRATDGFYVKLNIANNVHELQHILWALGKDANLKI